MDVNRKSRDACNEILRDFIQEIVVEKPSTSDLMHDIIYVFCMDLNS